MMTMANIANGTHAELALESLVWSSDPRVGPALREMARWRLANPELNLGELARRMKLSKSAVNHRLRRLQQVAGHSGGGASPNPARRSA